MWWFLFGIVVGALFMAWVFGDSVEVLESELHHRKSVYRYTYDDVQKAWREGFENKPPRPPAMNYDI